MPKTDKRRRADLDLFVLGLIESGISTLYEFQKFAGISQGASVPALRRLIDGGLVGHRKQDRADVPHTRSHSQDGKC
jgi:hypothetical protein